MLIYNMIEYNSNYSYTTGSLLLRYKDEAINFDVDIVRADAFQFDQCKTKLLGNTIADVANKILRNSAVNAPVKYQLNVWKSLETPLII